LNDRRGGGRKTPFALDVVARGARLDADVYRIARAALARGACGVIQLGV
jgi:hypothetical protein